MKRRVLPLILAVLLLAQGTAYALAPVRTYEDQFADVPAGAWYYDNVRCLYELGLTNGHGREDRFAPSSEITVAEVLAMAARLRSLYDWGDGEAGPAAFDGEAWYEPYAAYLQSLGVIGQEFEGAGERPASRAEMAHVLAGVLPVELFEPVNQAVITAGHLNRNYITDVNADTPYAADILRLYAWGILDGVDGTGSFLPGDSIPRSQVAAMVTRLVYDELRIRLNWDYASAYSRAGTALQDLVCSDGTFFPAPGTLEEIHADVRYMLSRGERRVVLDYPQETLTKEAVDELTQAFLHTARLYVEQTYNNIVCAYSTRSGVVSMTFSSSLYGDELLEDYRQATADYAASVHDQLWAEGTITADMTEYDKARAYFTWLCENCRYDFASDDSSMSHSGYRAFAEGLAVCDGYTAAYNLLLKLEGIDCATVSTEDHIWTVATLDGQEYHIDVTWGDRTGAIAYRYFAMTEADALARFQ